MANLYYQDQAEIPEQVGIGDLLELTGEDARHAVTVSRLKPGENIQIGDGRGRIFHCEAISVSEKNVKLEVLITSETTRAKPEIWLIQALAKGGRDELAIQMATELGVTGVIPWAASRSISKWDAQKAKRNIERWQKILREAAKQSIRSFIPEIKEVINTDEIAELAKKAQVLILDPSASASLKDIELSSEKTYLVVGPEGGFSPKEIDRFEDSGAIGVHLGPEILRTSTAGAAAIAALNLKQGKW